MNQVARLLTLLLACSATLVKGQTPLSFGFDHPQDSCRTKVWWFHGEAAATHESLTADLAAFREKGVGGVVYYDQVHGSGEGAAQVFSPEWWDELLFSAREAHRLGLSFEVNVGNGYVAGGRWITPERSMQRIACTELVVDGGRTVDVSLPLPARMPGDWHQDVALWAVPYDALRMQNAELQKGVNRFATPFTARSITYDAGGRGKARTSSMQVPPTHRPLAQTDPTRFFGCGFRELPPIGELQVSDDGIIYNKVCDLRPRYSALGGVKSLTVSFPAVTGRYFRLVCDTTVAMSNIRLSARAQIDNWQPKASLISDYIDDEQTPRYRRSELIDFSQSIDLTSLLSPQGTLSWQAPKGRWLLLRFVAVSTGGRTKHGRKEALGLECDKLSTAGARLHWQCYVKPVVDSIRACGVPLAGVCMDSHEAGPQNWTTDLAELFRRLRGYDLRPFLPVMAGMVVGSTEASARFLYDLRRTISDLVTTNYYGEFNRLCRDEGLTLTAQAIGGALSMTGDAIEVKKLIDKPQGEFWAYQTEGNYDIKECASAAHVYGKQIASGEAFTDATYRHTLADIKHMADAAYAFGINEFVVCASAYQPWMDRRLSTANGRQYVLNRKNTLWPMSRPFWDYQARCAWMLRQGKPVSDLALYLGDQVPIRILSHRLPEMPQGYDFDALTTDALLHRLTAKEGRLVLPDGTSYSLLLLPANEALTPAAQRKVDTLKAAGAHVWNPHSGQSLSAALATAGLTPDVAAPSARRLYFCHRRTAEADIYFLNNHSDEPVSDCFTFRATAPYAELWNPVTGQRQRLKATCADGRTSISLRLAPRESCFIVLAQSPSATTPQPASALQVPTSPIRQTLSGPWQVRFDAAAGGPAEPVVFPTLTDWSQHSDPRIKYYSGTADYTQTFVLGKKDRPVTYTLAFDQLGAVAEVEVNGQLAGTVWCSPWTLDITPYVRQGQNQLTIRVASTLWNRLVGDALRPEADRLMQQTTPVAKPTDALEPSGLVGTVSIIEIAAPDSRFGALPTEVSSVADLRQQCCRPRSATQRFREFKPCFFGM